MGHAASRVRHPSPDHPHMAPIHYPRVVFQLLWRMRIDLVLMALVCWVLHLLHPHTLNDVLLNSGAQATLGIAVGLFLSWRNAQAIQRWWEARPLWGSVVNQSRNWRDTLLAVIDVSPGGEMGSEPLLRLHVLAVWLLNLELRGYGRADLRERVLALAQDLGFDADVSLQDLCRERSRALRCLFEQKRITGLGRDALLRSAVDFNNAIGGLQKIRNTPIPPPYDACVRLITWLYGAELFNNLHDKGQPWVGVPFFLAFLVAERLAAYVEDPFDWDHSMFSIPLNHLCIQISADLLAAESPFRDCLPCRDPAIWD